MYKLLVALAAVLAISAAKPSLGYTYGSYVAPVASYSAYSAPAYSSPVYSPQVYSSYAAAPAYAAAPVAAFAAAPAFATAPVATVAAAPAYAAAPVAAVATAPLATTYSAAYPAYSGYSAPVAYTNEYPSSFLWKKK